MTIDLWLCALDPTASTGIYVSEIGKERLVAIETSNYSECCINYHTVGRRGQMALAAARHIMLTGDVAVVRSVDIDEE